jgi:Ca2+-binding EF-hand superfamily protein
MLQGKMIDLFHTWDDDSSGDITLVEFKKALEAMGMQGCPNYQVTELFESFDVDNSGYIDYRCTTCYAYYLLTICLLWRHRLHARYTHA